MYSIDHFTCKFFVGEKENLSEQSVWIFFIAEKDILLRISIRLHHQNDASSIKQSASTLFITDSRQSASYSIDFFTYYYYACTIVQSKHSVQDL